MSIKEEIVQTGELLKSAFGGEFVHEEKARFDLVSEWDVLIEERLISWIRRNHPSDSIYAEESGEYTGTSGSRWIIDPIDGTTNFVMGKPYFSISVAKESGGFISEAYVFNPISDELFWTTDKETDAYLNRRAIRCSATDTVESALVAFGFSARMGPIEKYFNDWRKVWENCRKAVGWISPALSICNVARGRIDILVDYGASSEGQSAASAILKKAGGVCLNPGSGHYSYRTKGIVCSNNALLPIIREVVGE